MAQPVQRTPIEDWRLRSVLRLTNHSHMPPRYAALHAVPTSAPAHEPAQKADAVAAARLDSRKPGGGD